MTRFNLKLLLLLFLPIISYGQNGTLTKVPTNTLNQNPLGYVEYLPANFDNSGNTKYPILYWLHGLGERGNGSEGQLDRVLDVNMANWLKTNDVEFIVIVPQDLGGYFGGTALPDLTEWVNTHYANVIDPDQKHMAGLSGATFGMATFLKNNSDNYKEFATLTPMAGDFNGALGYAQHVIDSEQHIWFHHGTDDYTLVINKSRRFHNELYALDDTRSRLTAYDGLGHSAWNKVYNASGQSAAQLEGTIDGTTYYHWTSNDPDVDWFGWMLAHGKTPQEPIAPTILSLDNSSINENNAVGDVVGLISSDGTTPITYSLAAGAGDEDNAAFSINENQLLIDVVTDFESKPTYNIRLQATNDQGDVSEAFVITVNDRPENPADEIIALVNFGRKNSVPVSGWNNILENIPSEDIAAVDLNDVEGNPTFWQLKITNGFLSTPNVKALINEGDYPDDVIAWAWRDRYGGEIEISGLDINQTYTIKVISNTAEDNALMECFIDGVKIGPSTDVQNNTAAEPFEANNITPVEGKIKVLVRGDNIPGVNSGFLAGLEVIQEPVLVPKGPTSITLDNNTIDEENDIGALIGELESDGVPQVTFSLVSGEGDDDNASFSIEGDELRIQAIADFETKPSYTVRIQAQNGLGSIQSAFTVLVTDIVEGPPVEIISQINFGRANSQSEPGWNDAFQNAPTIEMPAIALLDNDGNSTPWQLKVTNSFLSTPNEIGPNPGDDSGRYPDNVLAHAWKDRYGGEVEISGLNDDLTYTIRVYGNTLDDEALMRCYVNTNQIEGSVNVQNNAINIPDFEFKVINVAPIQGKIKVLVDGDNQGGKNFAHLAAMVIVQEVDADPVAPTDIILSNSSIDENNPVGAVIGTLSTDGTPEIEYSLVSGVGDADNSSFIVVDDRLIINTSTDYETQTAYNIRLQALNGQGVVDKAFVIDVNDLNDDASVPITAQINFGRANTPDVAGWNTIKLNAPTTNMVPVSLEDNSGNATPWQLGIANNFLSTPNLVGPITGDDSGRYPDNVLIHAWEDRYGGIVEISGLNNNLSYTIHVYGNTSEDESLMQCFVNSNQVGGTVDVQFNATTGLDYQFEIADVSPVQGKIQVEVRGRNSIDERNFAHLAAMVITQQAQGDGANARRAFVKTEIVEEEANQLYVYPNPTQRELTVMLDKEATVKSVELYGASGGRSKQLDFYRSAENQSAIVLDLERQKPGMYIIQIHTDKGLETFKVLKQ